MEKKSDLHLDSITSPDNLWDFMVHKNTKTVVFLGVLKSTDHISYRIYIYHINKIIIKHLARQHEGISGSAVKGFCVGSFKSQVQILREGAALY